jgi:hypothetical protein
MKLKYIDVNLSGLTMEQFIAKYELLIPHQKIAYNKELPEGGEYYDEYEDPLFGHTRTLMNLYDLVLFEREETNKDLIIENFTPTNLEDEEEYKRCCEWSFDYHLTDKERSKLLYAGLNDGTIWLVYDHEEDTISETPEDLNHEYNHGHRCLKGLRSTLNKKRPVEVSSNV